MNLSISPRLVGSLSLHWFCSPCCECYTSTHQMMLIAFGNCFNWCHGRCVCRVHRHRYSCANAKYTAAWFCPCCCHQFHFYYVLLCVLCNNRQCKWSRHAKQEVDDEWNELVNEIYVYWSDAVRIKTKRNEAVRAQSVLTFSCFCFRKTKVENGANCQQTTEHPTAGQLRFACDFPCAFRVRGFLYLCLSPFISLCFC